MRRRGFTLVELVAVAVIAAILAVSVIPGFATIDGARRAAAADEAARICTLARAHATATGDVTGVLLELADQTLAPIRIDRADQSAIEPLPGPLGQGRPTLSITARFPGVSIASVTLGDARQASGAIWFGYDGTPRLRDADLRDIGPATHDALIEFTGGERVRVRRLSGAIEREADR